VKPVSGAAACEMNTRADAGDFIYGEARVARAGAGGATGHAPGAWQRCPDAASPKPSERDRYQTRRRQG